MKVTKDIIEKRAGNVSAAGGRFCIILRDFAGLGFAESCCCSHVRERYGGSMIDHTSKRLL